MNGMRWIVLGTVVWTCVAPVASAVPVSGGAWGQALLRRLVTKASETAIAKAIEEMVRRGLQAPTPETYQVSSSPAEYFEKFDGFLGNLPRITRYRLMWVDPVSGEPQYETTETTGGQTRTSREPFYWVTGTRKLGCKDPGPDHRYDYRVSARLKYRVRNTVVQPSPGQGVGVHPVRLCLGGKTVSSNCLRPDGGRDLLETSSLQVPKNGYVDQEVHYENLDVTLAYVEYDVP